MFGFVETMMQQTRNNSTSRRQNWLDQHNNIGQFFRHFYYGCLCFPDKRPIAVVRVYLLSPLRGKGRDNVTLLQQNLLKRKSEWMVGLTRYVTESQERSSWPIWCWQCDGDRFLTITITLSKSWERACIIFGTVPRFRLSQVWPTLSLRYWVLLQPS